MMGVQEIQIDSRVAEIRNGEPYVFRFEEHKHKADGLSKLYWAYNNQAYWLIEAAKHTDSVYQKARLFGKAAYAMRQAAQVKSWEEIRNSQMDLFGENLSSERVKRLEKSFCLLGELLRSEGLL